MNTLQRWRRWWARGTGLPGPTIWRIGRQLDLAGEKVVRLHHRDIALSAVATLGAFPPVACGARISRRDDRSLLRRLLDGPSRC